MQDSRWPYLAAMPPSAPRAHGPFGRAFGRTLLRLGRWRIEGEFPDVPRLVIIAAPHTSALDGIWGLVGKLALGLDVCIIAKAELFHWPYTPILKWLRVRPVDRSRAHGMVGQASALLRDNERLWFLLAPEGTRRPVKRWKSGFWHIARNAKVPVMCAAFDYDNRVIRVGPTVEMTSDEQADIARLTALYAPYPGRHPQPGGWRDVDAAGHQTSARHTDTTATADH